MTYDETLTFLYKQLPMYQRVGNKAFKKGLGNTIALLEALGNPHMAYPCIHIAGTNGKGTVAHLMASAFQASGWKTGLYTSPHYVDFRERFKVDGQMVSEDFVIDFVDRISQVITTVKPSFFEITVALAFEAFRAQDVDVAVIETGLGGRLDSTNVIDPVISVITNISFDHMEMLGDTLPLIAAEKAGIIKQGVPVVIGENGEAYNHVFEDHAQARQCGLTYADRTLDVHNIDASTIGLVGGETGEEVIRITQANASPFFGANMRTAYCALSVLGRSQSEFVLKKDKVREGFEHFEKLTNYKGRWQVIGSEPLTIADSGHNEAGLTVTMNRLTEMAEGKTLHMVLGFVVEKDLGKILRLLPADAKYYFCRPNVPRGMPVEQLVEQAESNDRSGTGYDSVGIALKSAQGSAMADDIIFVGGSTFVVAEVV